MNVHQAKGLEAPVVFLADPYTPKMGGRTLQHLRREEGEIVAPVVKSNGHSTTITHAPLGWHEDSDDAFKTEEERHDTAERHRLLYVAATRAERLLVVSTYPSERDKGYWSDLYDALDRADIPKLAVPAVEPPPTSAAPAPDLSGLRADRERRIERGAVASYHIDTPTSGKNGGTALSMEDGYGPAFGTAVHHAVELLVRHRHNPPAFREADLHRLIEREGGDATSDAVARLRSMIAGFQESEIWDEVQAAEAVHPEYRFAHVRHDAAGDGQSAETVVRGTIDLLYKHDGAWTVVDVKSDRVDAPKTLTDTLGPEHGYHQQVASYVRAWRALSREPMRRAGLWFADVDAFHIVEMP